MPSEQRLNEYSDPESMESRSAQDLNKALQTLAEHLQEVGADTSRILTELNLYATQRFGREDSHKENQNIERLLTAYVALANRLQIVSGGSFKAAWATREVERSISLESRLSKRLEISHEESLIRLWEPTMVLASMEPISPKKSSMIRKRPPVRVGIASMAGRELGLARVVDIVAPQADEVFVYLNGIQEIPKELPAWPNVQYYRGVDIGDRGKFAFLDGYEGYYITCDDDIEYSSFHVASIIAGIERYGRKAIVGWHGSIFRPEFSQFYDSDSRRVLSFRFERGLDTSVHLLGTGVCGFHTSTIDISLSDFIYPNMADIFLALAAKRQEVPMIVLSHGRDWATPLDVGPSISSVALGMDAEQKNILDVGLMATEMVKSHFPWKTISPPEAYERRSFRVAFIGRTDRKRWKKGGILKSAHLTVEQLRRFGVELLLEDIVTGDPKGLHGNDADIVMVYTGDPERPDFERVESLVRWHALADRKVLVNLSYNGMPSRTEFILKKMSQWREETYGANIYLMSFTEAIRSSPIFDVIGDRIIVIPKTIESPAAPVSDFAQTEGVFLGDIGKLSDETLLGAPASEWIQSIRRTLPGVKLYGVRQYKPTRTIPLDLDEVWPFLGPREFVERVGGRRLMISLVKFATFEMVPVEAAALGIPVAYPQMPQSLSEYLSLSGYEFRDIYDLMGALPTLYYDPMVWRSLSESGIHRGRAINLANSAGQLYLRLASLL